MKYSKMGRAELKEILAKETERYENYKSQNLKLDLSRGKPSKEQLDLSMDYFDALTKATAFQMSPDYRNYGMVDGIPEMKEIFGDLINVDQDEIMVMGNSSLNIMYDTVQRGLQFGFSGCRPQNEVSNRKWLCPAPGYDRHFGVTQTLGYQLITIPMRHDGPDMDIVEELIQDETVKGIWCVPKYSNPQGIVYSEEVVNRFARLCPKAKDFRVYWDNAYMVHCVEEQDIALKDVFKEAKKYNNEDLFFMFGSTSKITFAGSGIAFIASSKANIDYLRKLTSVQTIGPDKLAQYAHALYFKNAKGVKCLMKKHAEILRPKFKMVLSVLEEELADTGVADWIEPKGGYFISCDLEKGTAKATLKLCKEAGVIFTPAGSTYPYGIDPFDSNVRLAPSFPPLDELEKAMRIFSISAKITTLKKLLG